MAGATALITALGLASAAGLNAYIPILVVGLLGRYTSLITLTGPFEYLTSPWVLLLVGILLLVDMVGDKIPAVDSALHAVGLIVQPLAGALVALAATSAFQVDPTVAAVAGLIAALGVHGVRATVRPIATATTAGVANPVISAIEDVSALGLSLLAVIVPFVALVVGIIFVVITVLAVRRWRRNAAEARAAQGG